MTTTAMHHHLLPRIFSTPPSSFASRTPHQSERQIHPSPANILSIHNKLPSPTQNRNFQIVSCVQPPNSSSFTPKNRFSSSTKLFVSGLSFRTTEESLRNAFKNFGELVEVNLVMDKIANRPKGFAFLRYAAEEESKKAIEGMHGKFLDGRVIFVEVAKSRAKLRKDSSKLPGSAGGM